VPSSPAPRRRGGFFGAGGDGTGCSASGEGARVRDHQPGAGREGSKTRLVRRDRPCRDRAGGRGAIGRARANPRDAAAGAGAPSSDTAVERFGRPRDIDFNKRRARPAPWRRCLISRLAGGGADTAGRSTLTRGRRSSEGPASPRFLPGDRPPRGRAVADLPSDIRRANHRSAVSRHMGRLMPPAKGRER